ncbi:MAG TPA: T9SS type A sorting domain-containing protein, partial [Flavobacteriales bacterium]|nr:T9SS type A sorting domain-containing protein [Flavobacteriales bacterium]
LTIGNFASYLDPDTVFYGWSGASENFTVYYIDAVDLRVCWVGEEERTVASFTVYPNPADNLVQFDPDINHGQLLKYMITDALGRVAQEGALTTSSIDLSRLPDGAYHVVLLLPEGKRTTKVFVRH